MNDEEREPLRPGRPARGRVTPRFDSRSDSPSLPRAGTKCPQRDPASAASRDAAAAEDCGGTPRTEVRGRRANPIDPLNAPRTMRAMQRDFPSGILGTQRELLEPAREEPSAPHTPTIRA